MTLFSKELSFLILVKSVLQNSKINLNVLLEMHFKSFVCYLTFESVANPDLKTINAKPVFTTYSMVRGQMTLES